MNIYQDSDGTQVSACEITAPTILNTIHGEVVANAGQWLVNLPNSMPVVMSAEDFSVSFILVEA